MPAARPSVVSWSRAGAAVLVLWTSACGPGGGGGVDCQAASECGAAEEACAGCPPLPEVLCLEGACATRPADAVDVRVDLNLDRTVAPQVRSVVHVVVDQVAAGGRFSCASAFEGDGLAPGANVLASGYKAVEGGTYHPGVNVGRVPEGEVAVVVLATDANAGRGEVLATGCVGELAAAAPSLDAGLVQVVP
jgi:hypothetical protein